MIEVRPTLAVLKELDRHQMLPRQVAETLREARRVMDRDSKLAVLSALGLSSLDIPLLRDARTRFASGRPDRHSAMSAKAGIAVYEVRDNSGAGWRGAVVGPDESGTAWLVHVDVHDRFHQTGPSAVSALADSCALGPSDLDRRLRDSDLSSASLPRERSALLEGLLEALITSAVSTAPEPVVCSGRFSPATMAVEVCSSVDPDWDTATAHDEMGDLVIRLSLASVGKEVRDEILQTCVPFLQPDLAMREALYKKDLLVVQVLLTRAGLIQLLATDRPLEPVEDRDPPAPVALHYTSKSSLTKAFVHGHAVRAVCGQWWVPVGDAQTHSTLPICPDCEREAPFAQAARDILARRALS